MTDPTYPREVEIPGILWGTKLVYVESLEDELDLALGQLQKSINLSVYMAIAALILAIITFFV